MVAYEFYWRDSQGEDYLIGILPERRKDTKRITKKSIMNWGRKIVDNKRGPNLESLYFIQVKVEDARYKVRS
jgi:hypothetical protein